MNAIPPSFMPAPGSAGAELAEGPLARWTALADAGRLVAALAGVEPEPESLAARAFPALIADAEPWRRECAEAGIADLIAIMEPGLAALIAVNARDADPEPAARALWREFVAARSALLALLPPSEA
ncbi:MAG TPA: hypothetical protein VFS49_10960 [Croceibacterium sp.]|nr:hypothetical protein [Croceibacterium sp.]